MFFGVLGGLLARTSDGADVPLGGALPRSLLAALLVAEGKPVSADALIDAMWDDEPPPSATATLHSTLSRLRKALEAAGETVPIRLQAVGYRLDVDLDQVDAWRFLRLAGDGRDLLRDDPAAALSRLRDAEALWRGPALSEFAERDFARPTAVRLDERRVDAVEDRLDAELALGAGPELLGTLVQLTEAHPLRERLRAQHALALYRGGRQAEGLDVLAATRRLLRDELGLDASPPLQELESRMLRQDADLQPARRPTVQIPRQRTADPTVGRDGELAVLRGLLHESAAGNVRFGVLEGEPGIGKTRMLDEVAALAAREGARVVWGRCADSDAAPAYWPWLEVLRSLAAGDASLKVPAELADLLDPRQGAEQAPTDVRRFRLFEAVTDALLAAARDAPIVVLLEDLQWADPASAELLQHLTVRLHDVAIAFVVSMRELELGRADAVSAAAAAITRRSGSRRLRLKPVPALATAALVESATSCSVSADTAAAIHRRTEGNPFYIGELSRLLRDADLLGDPAAVERAEVPAGVRDVVRRRLAALPADTRAVLDVAAVVGREADLALLARAAGRPVDECIDALEPALASRIFVPVPEVPGRHRFAHALVHEAALAEVSSLRLARLHTRVAEAIVAVSGDSDDNAEIVAGHLWAAAGIVAPAVAADALMRAAEVAVRRTAYETADDLLGRALQLRRAAGGSREASEAELLTTVRLVSLRRARHGYSRAYDATVALDRADELARRSGRQDLYLGLLLAQWGASGTSGDIPTQERLAQRILALSEQSSDPVVRLVGQSTWGVSCWHLGRMREADDRMAMVEAAVPDLSDDDLARMGELDAASLFLSFCVHVRVVAGSIDVEGRFEELAERFTRPYDRLVVANFGGLTAAMRGDAEAAARWAGWGLQNDEDEGFAFFGGACSIYLGWARAVQGDAAGVALIERGLDRFALAGARTGHGLMVALQVEAMLATGRPVHDARRVLEDGAREVAKGGERFILPYLELARARVAAAAGDGQDAVEQHLRTAISLADEMGIVPVAALAAALTP